MRSRSRTEASHTTSGSNENQVLVPSRVEQGFLWTRMCCIGCYEKDTKIQPLGRECLTRPRRDVSLGRHASLLSSATVFFRLLSVGSGESRRRERGDYDSAKFLSMETYFSKSHLQNSMAFFTKD